MSGFFGNLFGMNQQPAAPAPANQVAAAAPGNPSPNPTMDPSGNPNHNPNNNQALPNGVPPGPNPPVQEPQKSPVDLLAELMQTPAKKPDGSQEFFNVTPEQVRAITEKANFSAAVPADVMQKAQSGDPAAMLQANQMMMQAMMQQMIPMTVAITRGGVEHGTTQLRQTLPSELAAKTVADNIIQENPFAKPLVDTLIPNLQAKNPHLSPAQLQAEAMKIIGGFADHIQQTRQQQQQQTNQPTRTNPGETDWSKHFNF